MNQLPTEIIDAITIDAAGEYDVEIQWMLDPYISRGDRAFTSESKLILATLRLVNKLFNRSATPLLFKNFDARCDGYDWHWDQSNPTHKLRMVTKSTLAMHVHHLQIGFAHYIGPEVAKRQYRKDLKAGLHGFLTMLPNLRTLQYRGPSKNPSVWELGDPVARKVAMVLHRVPLPALVELRLRFQTTQDFGQLFVYQRNCIAPQIPNEQIMRRLRHLNLDIHEHIPWNADEYDYAMAKIHASHIQRLVEMAVNVESLSINSGNLLNVDNIKLHNSARLRHIRLHQMEISSRSLESLTNHLGDSIMTMDYCGVRLLSGTWRQALTNASKFTSLLELKIRDCGYSWHGESAHLANPANPDDDWQWQKWEGIDSDDISDIQALSDLQRQVNSNRVSAGRLPAFHGTA